MKRKKSTVREAKSEKEGKAVRKYMEGRGCVKCPGFRTESSGGSWTNRGEIQSGVTK